METGYIKFIDTETGKPIIEVKIVDGTVWMTINEMADLFGVYVPTISKQLKIIFKEGLLKENDVIQEYRYTKDAREYIRIYYNLETIISLSFRIQSFHSKALRQWVYYSLRKVRKDRDFLIDSFLITKEYSSFHLN